MHEFLYNHIFIAMIKLHAMPYMKTGIHTCSYAIATFCLQLHRVISHVIEKSTTPNTRLYPS